MIDPVRTGPVSAIAANAAGSTEVRGQSQRRAQIATQQEAAPPAKANLPRLLELVADLTNAGPPVDQSKIAQVRRAIADGSYTINIDALAKSIVSFVPRG